MLCCNQPFERAEILSDGNVYTCCPNFISFYSIGNVYEQPFKDIWNGEKVAKLREMIINNDMSLCSEYCCARPWPLYEVPENIDIRNITPPKTLSFSTDYTCNIQCIFCRKDILRMNHNLEEMTKEIDNIWIPALEGVELFEIGETGEPLSSIKERTIIKKAVEKYPNLKIHLHTNGILGNERTLKELGIYDKIDIITVSVHAATEKTYRKSVIKGGNFKKVLENISLYSKMQSKGLIKNLKLVFVVWSQNYKEMAEFAKFGIKHNAIVFFWPLYKASVEENQLAKDFDNYSIINPNHPEYDNFTEVLKNPVFDNPLVCLFPAIKQIRDGLNR